MAARAIFGGLVRYYLDFTDATKEKLTEFSLIVYCTAKSENEWGC